MTKRYNTERSSEAPCRRNVKVNMLDVINLKNNLALTEHFTEHDHNFGFDSARVLITERSLKNRHFHDKWSKFIIIPFFQ